MANVPVIAASVVLLFIGIGGIYGIVPLPACIAAGCSSSSTTIGTPSFNCNAGTSVCTAYIPVTNNNVTESVVPYYRVLNSQGQNLYEQEGSAVNVLTGTTQSLQFTFTSNSPLGTGFTFQVFLMDYEGYSVSTTSSTPVAQSSFALNSCGPGCITVQGQSYAGATVSPAMNNVYASGGPATATYTVSPNNGQSGSPVWQVYCNGQVTTAFPGTVVGNTATLTYTQASTIASSPACGGGVQVLAVSAIFSGSNSIYISDSTTYPGELTLSAIDSANIPVTVPGTTFFSSSTTTVTISASNIQSGYILTGWLVDGTPSAIGSNNVQVTMNQFHAIQPVVVKQLSQCTVAVGATGCSYTSTFNGSTFYGTCASGGYGATCTATLTVSGTSTISSTTYQAQGQACTYTFVQTTPFYFTSFTNSQVSTAPAGSAQCNTKSSSVSQWAVLLTFAGLGGMVVGAVVPTRRKKS